MPNHLVETHRCCVEATAGCCVRRSARAQSLIAAGMSLPSSADPHPTFAGLVLYYGIIGDRVPTSESATAWNRLFSSNGSIYVVIFVLPLFCCMLNCVLMCLKLICLSRRTKASPPLPPFQPAMDSSSSAKKRSTEKARRRLSVKKDIIMKQIDNIYNRRQKKNLQKKDKKPTRTNAGKLSAKRKLDFHSALSASCVYS